MKLQAFAGALLVAAGALVAACGGGGGGSPTGPSGSANPPASNGVMVSVVSSSGNTAYQPNPVRAAAGDTVSFRNADSVLHRIVLDDGSADLGDIAPGATSRAFTVRSAAAVTFHCTIHPSMVGSINGTEAPEPPCIDSYGYAC